MATNQTPNYGLNQWVPTDQVIHSEFNADNLKIDQTLKSLSDQITQHKQEVSEDLQEGNTHLSQEIDQMESTLTQKITQVQTNLTQAQSTLTQKIDQTKTELTQKITQTESTLNQKITKTNSDLTTKINGVEDRLEQQIGKKGNCFMVTGSYKGNGKSGAENPTRLSFSSPPKLVVISGNSYQLTLVPSVTSVYPHGFNYNAYNADIAWKGNTVEISCSHYPQYQLNTQGETYYYFAILAAT